jgi:hypothetical protein
MLQLYALHSAASWGMGDLGDLSTFVQQSHGAGLILLNPLHAITPTLPVPSSPYSPSSRRFANPLYLRVADTAEYRRADPALRAQVDALVDEALAVCDAAGITLLKQPSESFTEAIETAWGHKPSILQDVLARRTTEVDVLNGGIADEGRRQGVPTPRHDAMVALVHGLESSW